MQKIVPNLWFANEAQEAADFYTSLFANSEIGNIMHYDEASAKESGQKEGTVLLVEFKLDGEQFIGINGGPIFKLNPTISFTVACETKAEIDNLHDKLSEGGSVLMPLDKYHFSERYAWVSDKYGVSWQLILFKGNRKITPSLMYTGKNAGKAEEAMKLYTELFTETFGGDNSKIGSVYRYGKNDYDKEDHIAHAVFTLRGEEFIAMDSGLDHKFNFNEAVSLLVNCETQEEIDKLWEGLSSDPKSEQCGWLKDKYGVSWQIAPAILDKLLQDKDSKKAARTMKAMLQMKKLDIEELLKAYKGK